MAHHFFLRIMSLNPRVQIQKSLVQVPLIQFTAPTITSRLPPMRAMIRSKALVVMFQSILATAIIIFIVPDRMDQFILETEKILSTIMGSMRGSILDLVMIQYPCLAVKIQLFTQVQEMIQSRSSGVHTVKSMENPETIPSATHMEIFLQSMLELVMTLFQLTGVTTIVYSAELEMTRS